MSQFNDPRRQSAPNQKAPASPSQQATPEQGISVDGFGQVLSMLQFADDAFRNSILRRIAQRDRNLAMRLHQALNER